MTVKELTDSLYACIMCKHNCKQCAFSIYGAKYNCQHFLIKAVEQKFEELVGLLDDSVNHHYYDTLEFYQEENDRLRDKLDKIKEFVNNQID